MHKNIFLQHLQAEPGPKVGVSALMLIQMVRPHEGLVTKSTHELLYPRVHSLVARQLVASEIENNYYFRIFGLIMIKTWQRLRRSRLLDRGTASLPCEPGRGP